jgi:hypothetical protein
MKEWKKLVNFSCDWSMGATTFFHAISELKKLIAYQQLYRENELTWAETTIIWLMECTIIQTVHLEVDRVLNGEK